MEPPIPETIYSEVSIIFRLPSIEFLKSALGRQLVVVMVTSSSLIALVFTAFEVSAAYRHGASLIEERHKNITLTQSDVFIQQMWALDFESARISIEGLAKLEFIDRVELLWKNDRTQVAGALVKEADIATVFPLSQTHNGRHYLLGELRVYSTLDSLRHEMLSLLVVRLFFNLLKTFFVSGLLLYFYHRFATVHLQAIAQYADSLVLREAYRPLDLKRKSIGKHDELQALSDAINRLGKRLHRQFVQHEQQQNQLEHLVEERTQHLQEANRQLIEKSRLATIGSLVGMVAHELRNPLGTIKASVLLLSAPDYQEDQAKVLARIE
ncbi:MAG: hypothetical protein ACPGSC_09620, partial [Granulosicoccaceae bacterium]